LALLNLQKVSLSFGSVHILDNVNIQIHSGEKICLLGRNGAGKSTLMKLINGDQPPDTGDIIHEKGLRTAILSQDVPDDYYGSVEKVIAGGVISHDENNHHDENDSRPIVDRVMTVLKISDGLVFENLSAGMKRRVLLARAIAAEPDILLLDEPTNHLDMESIIVLEDFLVRYNKTVFFVTHDRTFLQKIANRILELDRGNLFDWKCGYNIFLQRKEEWLESEQARNAVFDKKLEKEEEWIRKGIKARRTRNEGRVRALQKMRKERSGRREVQGSAKIQIQKAEISGKMIIEAENISFGYTEKLIINDFTTRILRGDKIGIIGSNGCGKSTLIKLLLNDLSPNVGTVRTGTKIEVAYSDQLRNSINPELTVRDNVASGSDIISFNGKNRHIIGYLQDFLFSPDMAGAKASVLSGGEKNRLMLAKLFTRSFNFLVMDEPTNDLDIETVELLEELLLDFEGTVIIVSHDRSFISNIASTVYTFDNSGRITEYGGGFEDWQNNRKNISQAEITRQDTSKQKKLPEKQKVKTKLSLKEKLELESLPGLMEKKEARKQEIFELLANPAFYQQQGSEVSSVKEELEQLDKDIDTMFSRWEELEAMQQASV